MGVLGALAAATRSAGVVLWLPALMLYLYGPREDRAPDFPRARWERGCAPATARARTCCGWGSCPQALACTWPTSPSPAARRWRRFTPRTSGAGTSPGPSGRVGRDQGGFDGARQLLSFQRRHVYFAVAAGSPFVAAGHNLMLLAFLLAAVPAVVGVLRTLPVAYGVYVIAALALPLSYPVSRQPLMSLPRFLVVLFPLGIWLAAWLAAHPRAQRPALVRIGRADGVLRRPVRHLALGGVVRGRWAPSGAAAERSWRRPEPPRPGGRPVGGREATSAPQNRAGRWMAPAALVGGLVLAAIGGLIVDIPALRWA